jgi:hypothetical protein
MPSYGQPFLAFIAWVIPISFLLTWLWMHTQSAWLATIMHGTLNIGAAFVFPLADPGGFFTFSAVGMAILAAGVVLVSWQRFTTRPVPPLHPAPSATLAATR